jgi:hypothetical protein
MLNVKLSPCLIKYVLWHEDMLDSGGRAPPFLTSATDGGEFSASRLFRFIPGTNCIKKLFGPIFCLDFKTLPMFEIEFQPWSS